MNAYIYQADLYCRDCASKIKYEINRVPGFWLEDSEYYPQGPYPNGGGEADSPQHCAACSLFLENPLTEEGEMYVLQSYEEYHTRGEWVDGKFKPITPTETINQWVTFYDYLDLANIGEGPY